MIWRLLPFGLVALLVAGSLVSDFLARRLVHIFKGRLTGNDPKAKWLKGSENFARMDEPRTMSRLGEDRNGKAAAPGDSQIVSMNR
jgi:hypothetical protein